VTEGPKHPPGWYPDPEQAATQRYWDGENWTEQRAPLSNDQTSGLAISPQTIRRVVGAVVAVFLILYFTGRLDHALYPVGLNLNECAKNGYGSVYCGDELTEYRNNVVQPIDEAQTEAQESLREFEAEQETEELFGP
jgi:Protein of unknown function (DUF2510)